MAKSNRPLVVFPENEMIELISHFTPENIAPYLDVTDLKADTLGNKLDKMARWAKELNCASVCVNPVEVDKLPLLLKGSQVKETYVMDFPLGKLPINQKAYITGDTIKQSRELRGQGKGFIDIDIVINTGRFKEDPAYTLEEINAMCEAADGEHLKVIIRSSELSTDEIYKISEVVAESKAEFIKNSTGMDAFGALPEHIKIMREVVGNEMGVKAAGGISDAMTAMRLFFAGAKDPSLHNPDLFRLGTSKPLGIVSSMGWLKHNTADWVKTAVVPCTICPYSHTGKLRRELREQYNKFCKTCEFNHFLEDKDY